MFGWLFLWVLISVALLSFSVWTFVILIRQKKTWRAFARKYKLRYRATRLMDSPEINGIYKGLPIAVFSSEHKIPGGRGERKMTAIEVEVNGRMPIAGAIASQGMVGIIQGLNYNQELQPEFAGWSTEHLIRCEDKSIMQQYFNEKRFQAFRPILDNKKYWALFIFQDKDVILRVDTYDPFEAPGALEKCVDELVKVAKILELGESEEKILVSNRTQRVDQRDMRLEIEDDAAPISLELEEDGEQSELSEDAGLETVEKQDLGTEKSDGADSEKK